MSELTRVTTEARIDAYEQVSPIFDILLEEIRKLSAKRPELKLARSQVRTINRVLKTLRYHLKQEPEGQFLDVLRGQQPNVVDAVLLMSEYEVTLHHFTRRYKYRDPETLEYEWHVLKGSSVRRSRRMYYSDTAYQLGVDFPHPLD